MRRLPGGAIALVALALVGLLLAPPAPAASAPWSHGPDPIPLLAPDLALPSPAAVACAQSPAHTAFRVVYAVPPATVDYEEIRVPTVRAGIALAQGLVLESSLPHGVDVRLKFFCNAEGDVDIVKVRTPTRSQLASFDTVVRDLRALGFDKPNEKYWVIYEGFFSCGGCAGIAMGWIDDRPGADNPSNSGNMFALTVIGNLGPQGHIAPLMHVMLHEASHTMGAVQMSAPHSSGGFHCNDGGDVMCYVDQAPGSDYDAKVCPRFQVTRVGPELPYDCGSDDYFHPRPAAGSYLDTHWNVGSPVNRWITWTPLVEG